MERLDLVLDDQDNMSVDEVASIVQHINDHKLKRDRSHQIQWPACGKSIQECFDSDHRALPSIPYGIHVRLWAESQHKREGFHCCCMDSKSDR